MRRSRNDEETEQDIRRSRNDGEVYAPMFNNIRARQPQSPDIFMLRGLGGEEKK
jgi:hypothetical protein